MTFSSDIQPAKRRGRNRAVSKSEIEAAWSRLRTAAEQGHIEANALLIALAENRSSLVLCGPGAAGQGASL